MSAAPSAEVVARRRYRDLGRFAPYAVLLVAALSLPVIALTGEPVFVGNIYNIGQRFAVIALPALGLALTMLAGEFDLSVPGSFLLASMIAVRFGAEQPFLWAIVAVALVAVIGVVNGLIIAYLKVDSVPVTLGSYLAMAGAVYLVGDSKSVSFDNFDVGFDLTVPLITVFARNLLIVIGVLVAAGLILGFTRWGPQLRAVGSDRRASATVGVRAGAPIVCVFAASAALSALGGVLQGYTLAFAQPSTSTLLLLTAVTCALIGGISPVGGSGSVLGLAVGVLAFATMEEALTIAHVDEYLADVITGALLLAVALVSAPSLGAQLTRIRHRYRLGPQPSRRI